MPRSPSDHIFDVAVRWRPRPESANACAQRLARTLTGLAAVHPLLARWNKRAETSLESRQPFCAMPPRVEELTATLESDPFTPGVPSDGYAVHAWNGREPRNEVWLRLLVGADKPAPVFPNEAQITINPRFMGTDFATAAILKPVLRSLVAAWEPDWGAVGPRGFAARWRRREPSGPEATRPKPIKGYPVSSGWMCYLCGRFAQRVSPPPSVITEREPGGGLLMVATEETFSGDNPVHLAAVDAIQESLAPLQDRA